MKKKLFITLVFAFAITISSKYSSSSAMAAEKDTRKRVWDTGYEVVNEFRSFDEEVPVYKYHDRWEMHGINPETKERESKIVEEHPGISGEWKAWIKIYGGGASFNELNPREEQIGTKKNTYEAPVNIKKFYKNVNGTKTFVREEVDVQDALTGFTPITWKEEKPVTPPKPVEPPKPVNPPKPVEPAKPVDPPKPSKPSKPSNPASKPNKPTNKPSRPSSNDARKTVKPSKNSSKSSIESKGTKKTDKPVTKKNTNERENEDVKKLASLTQKDSKKDKSNKTNAKDKNEGKKLASNTKEAREKDDKVEEGKEKDKQANNDKKNTVTSFETKENSKGIVAAAIAGIVGLCVTGFIFFKNRNEE